MRILYAFVKRTPEKDIVSLHTSLPAPRYPYGETLTLTFDALIGTGSEYVKKHFGITAQEIK